MTFIQFVWPHIAASKWHVGVGTEEDVQTGFLKQLDSCTGGGGGDIRLQVSSIQQKVLHAVSYQTS